MLTNESLKEKSLLGYFRNLETNKRVVLPTNTHLRFLITAVDVLHVRRTAGQIGLTLQWGIISFYINEFLYSAQRKEIRTNLIKSGNNILKSYKVIITKMCNRKSNQNNLKFTIVFSTSDRFIKFFIDLSNLKVFLFCKKKICSTSRPSGLLYHLFGKATMHKPKLELKYILKRDLCNAVIKSQNRE